MDCRDNQVINPKTNRCIEINGVLYKKLVKEGIIQAPNNPDENNKIALNPKTKRWIKIGSYLYKKLVKEGIILQKEAIQQVQYQCDKNRGKCKNSTTFMMFDDVHAIPDSDFLRTPDGFCFSSTELIEYIDSQTFKNVNPHETSIALFKEKDVDILLKDKPELLKKIKNYFESEMKKQSKFQDIYVKTLDVFYEVANTGRVCYFNNLYSWEKEDSSVFDRSIEHLQNLSSLIQNLPVKYKVAYSQILKYVESANNGSTCIHGTGLQLIMFFLDNFNKLDIDYDSNQTGLYFVKNGANVLFYSYEHRVKPDDALQRFSSLKEKVQNIRASALSDRSKRSILFTEKCSYDPYMVTLDTLDEWKELPDWRKIMFNKDKCFDVLYLVRVMTDDLNGAKNNNPYPRFPINPFTQKQFTVSEIKHIKSILIDNYVKINQPLRIFFSNSDFWTNSRLWQNKMIETFEREYRFVRLNNIISGELHCIGMWHNKSFVVSRIENMILSYLNTSNPIYLNNLKRQPNQTIPGAYYYTLEIKKNLE